LNIPVTGDYGDFLVEFEWTDLFNGWGNLNEIPFVVYPLKEFRREVLRDGRSFVAFGDRGSQHVFFDESKILSEEPSAVFLLSKGQAKEIYPNLSKWLKSAYKWAKSKYSRTQWNLIIKGAEPFTEHEQNIIEARGQFQWRHIGFSEDGDALFEADNKSKMVLPFLSIGIKDCDDAILLGGVWLKIDHIHPRKSGVAKAGCYKDQIPREKLVVFSKPNPVPERRDRYWEFGVPE
jgi:hypothetical protein